ncbi:unnamed protein product [Soboliphyme baturini]|uniref:m7GpppN-mRNA hydrolase n=1 Tax=Soboliphyme baturini TaxID=241478 RepID=A0A183IR26_9BILA|nr:unnamed protein product [Soboliphyme baturini]
MVIPQDILDELCSRFLVNLPDEEKLDPVRVCFQAELAHWFYIDFYCSEEKSNGKSSCRPCGIREFIRTVFAHLPYLQTHLPNVDKVIEQWRSYKSSVPVYGAILISSSEEEVLLVQGYYAKSSWGFPKGKVNENEEPQNCAIREVLEETGFDIGDKIDESLYVERKVGENVVGLYLITGVSQEFVFRPQTRHEIKRIQWFRIEDLPQHKSDHTKNAIGIYPSNFFTVIPFVEFITYWVRTHNMSMASSLVLSSPKRSHGNESALTLCASSGRGSKVFRHIRKRCVSTPALEKLRHNGVVDRLLFVPPQYLLKHQLPVVMRPLKVESSNMDSLGMFLAQSFAIKSIPTGIRLPVATMTDSWHMELKPCGAWENFKIKWELVFPTAATR